MYNQLIKLKIEDKYAVGNYYSPKPFIILEGGAKIIFDELLKIDDKQFNFNNFVDFFSKKYCVDKKIIKEDVNLVIHSLEYQTQQEDHNNTTNTYGKVYSYYYSNKKIFKASFEVTYGCNLKCAHCYLGDDVNSAKTKITLTKAKEVMDQLKDEGVIDLTFTGGEFFSHPNAIEMVEYAAKKHFLINILTNGTLITEEIAKKLATLPISTIRISLYGLENYHDNFVKLKGAFSRSLNALILLNKYRPGLGIGVSTATKSNYDDLLTLNKILKKKNIEHKISTIIWPTTKGDLSPTKFRVSEEQLINLLKLGLINISETQCASGISRVRITPFGEVNPCELFRNTSFGNIFDNTIAEIFNSNSRKKWISMIETYLEKRECKSCSKRQNCPNCIGISFLENDKPTDKTKSLCMFANAKIKYLEMYERDTIKE